MMGLGGETQDCSLCHKSPQSASAPATCRCHRAFFQLSYSVSMDCPCPVTINTRQGPQLHWRTTNDTINGLQTFFYHCLKPILSNFWYKKWYQHHRTMGLNQTRNNGDPADEEKVEPDWSHKTATAKQALTWNPQEKRGRGKPQNTWRRSTEREGTDVNPAGEDRPRQRVETFHRWPTFRKEYKGLTDERSKRSMIVGDSLNQI